VRSAKRHLLALWGFLKLLSQPESKPYMGSFHRLAMICFLFEVEEAMRKVDLEEKVWPIREAEYALSPTKTIRKTFGGR